MHRRPYGGVTHEKITIAHQCDWNSSGSFERESRSHRHAGPRPDTCAAVMPDVIEGVTPMEIRAVPAER